MKPMPAKARDLTIAGIVMAATSFAWLMAPDARRLALAFVVFGVGFIAQALYLWRKSGA